MPIQDTSFKLLLHQHVRFKETISEFTKCLLYCKKLWKKRKKEKRNYDKDYEEKSWGLHGCFGLFKKIRHTYKLQPEIMYDNYQWYPVSEEFGS